MARVFITGSADGLGRAAAQTLLDDGHEVVVHARNSDRLEAVGNEQLLEFLRTQIVSARQLDILESVIPNSLQRGGHTVGEVSAQAVKLQTDWTREARAESGWRLLPGVRKVSPTGQSE